MFGVETKKRMHLLIHPRSSVVSAIGDDPFLTHRV
jgi:hypothetical protein